MKTPSEIIHELTENEKALLVYTRSTKGTEHANSIIRNMTLTTLNKFLNLDILNSEIEYHPFQSCQYREFYLYLSDYGKEIVELLYELDQL